MASWTPLLTLDRKSDDFTRLARQLLSDQRHRKFEVSQFTEEEALNLIELMEPTVGLTLRSAIGVIQARSIPYRSSSMRTSLPISKAPRSLCFGDYVVHSGGCQGIA